MTQISKLISVSEVVDAMRYDYRGYLVQRLTDHRNPRVSMHTELDHYPVFNALIKEVMTDGDAEASASRDVVRALIDQGVDISAATDMAIMGLKRLVTEISSYCPDITFAQLRGGDMSLTNSSDLFLCYALPEEA